RPRSRGPCRSHRCSHSRRCRGDAHKRAHSVSTPRLRGPHAGALDRVDLAGSARRLGRRSREGDAAHCSESESARAAGQTSSRCALYEVWHSKACLPFRFISSYPLSRREQLAYVPAAKFSMTLMVLDLSPLAAHLNESLTSFRLATKVAISFHPSLRSHCSPLLKIFFKKQLT
ncbi:hypothetical protein FB451DRAFT_1235210, partial [Mycena latifolia]